MFKLFYTHYRQLTFILYCISTWSCPLFALLVISWLEARSSICSITRSFLELQSPDFAWKFVWTVQTNTRNLSILATLPRSIAKLIITHSFLELQSPDFAWKFVWTVRTNFEIFFEKQNGSQIKKYKKHKKYKK